MYVDEIREFIVENFLFGELGSLEDDTPFIENGIVDSTGVLELISFLETKFNIKVEEQEVIPENLDSVNKAANFVAAKLKDGAAVAA